MAAVRSPAAAGSAAALGAAASASSLTAPGAAASASSLTAPGSAASASSLTAPGSAASASSLTAPGSAASASSLTVSGVSVQAGGHTILSGIDLRLHPGELCALIGPSGAGKSTLIKVLLGIREADGGRVRLGSAEPAAAGPVGYVPQKDALHRALTVERALTYAARLRMGDVPQGEQKRRILHAMQDVGLIDRRDVRISKLSGGQQKRVSVALELLTSPALLILDEPTSGLDPGLESQLMTLFARLAAKERIVLVATHAMESLDLCQALCILVEGRVVYFGPPREAPGYFGVDRYAAIFHRLRELRGREWHQRYEANTESRAFLARPRPSVTGGASVPSGASPTSGPSETG